MNNNFLDQNENKIISICKLERAIGGFKNHDAGVEEREVVSGGGDLREAEEDVERAEDDGVGVHEHDSAIFRELP